MTHALGGLTVVEFGTAMAGPFCAMMLGDFGAEVVKVERIGVGDDSRHWPPSMAGIGHYFLSANRNKRSLALDVKNPRGLEVARRLVSKADVVVDNYRLGALAAAGLDYEGLSRTNPGLVWCSISGFGATGPRAHDRANDLFMQAFSGGMSVTGEDGGGPMKMGVSVADLGAGMLATIGILMALEARHRTGLGQRVDTSLLEGQVAMLSYHFTRYFADGRVPVGGGSGSHVGVPYQAFRAADDWVVLAVINDRMFESLCGALDRPRWAADDRFRLASGRFAHRDELVGMIAARVATRAVADWVETLTRAGVPCSPVNRLDAVAADEQVRAREMIVDVALPDGRSVRMPGLPVKLDGTPASIRLPPPALGADTAGILSGLGYSLAEIDALRRESAVGASDMGVEDASGAWPSHRATK